MDTVARCLHIILMNFQPSDQLTRCMTVTLAAVITPPVADVG